MKKSLPMSDSILDKVLSSKEDQEKQAFDPLEVVNALMRTVSSKEADVVRRRFGLSELGKETLETIGAHYAVTRERIRQIENQSIEKMRSSATFPEVMRPVEHLVTTLLDHHGGIMTKEMLYDSLLNLNSDKAEYRQAVDFLLLQLLNDKVEEGPRGRRYEPSWKLKLTSVEFVDAAIAALEQVIRQVGQPQSFDDLYRRVQETEFYRQNDQKLTEDAVLSYLEVSSRLARNPYDEYGLASWGLIQPKRMNDRVYLTLKKEGKPMHFEEIAKRISRVFRKKAYPPTVHNELILNDEYVLVGRGIYALKEWGFKEGVVADVIVDILRERKEPLSRAEIVKAVLQQRIVKKNTIHLALTDKTLFRKLPDGRFVLNETAVKPEEKPNV
jgi:DNA-directed RNA polymerase delta subunit